MRSLALFLALAVSNVAPTLCQVKCAGVPHQEAGEAPSCHEEAAAADAPEVAPPDQCCESGGAPSFVLPDVKAWHFVALPASHPHALAASADEITRVAIPTSVPVFESPPPLIVPLRI